jgi:hypothetical protein
VAADPNLPDFDGQPFTVLAPSVTSLDGGSLPRGEAGADVQMLELVEVSGTNAQRVGVAARLANLLTALGSDGASPPSIAGTGVRGFLRAIYDRLGAGVDVTDRSGRTLGHAIIDTSALPTGAATALKQDSEISLLTTVAGKDFATQATLAQILAKLIAAPATESTLASILAKLIADPATAAKQDTAAAKLDSLHADLATTLHADLATTLHADLATTLHGDLGTLNAKDFATQTTLAQILAKLNAGVGTTPTAAGDVATTLTDLPRTTTSVATGRVAVSTSLACKWVTLVALPSNSDYVAVGATAVEAAVGSERGTLLAPGGATTIPVDNASKVFMDVRVDGHGVTGVAGA